MKTAFKIAIALFFLASCRPWAGTYSNPKTGRIGITFSVKPPWPF
jgi:hypothetical protein